MFKQKRQPTLARRVVLAWMAVLTLSNIIIGSLSYTLYKRQLVEARAFESQNVAVSMALRIDGDKFSQIMETLEKNDYWYEVKEYADNVAKVFNTAFIYILDANYTDEVTYFAEGATDDDPFDLGVTEAIADVYDDLMFETIRTGIPCFTAPYPSGEYGDMVSGFAAITDSQGKIVGVVGVDFYYGDVEAQLRTFALWLIGIVTAFLIFCYFFMSYMGNKLAGRPLISLDEAAQKLSVGDMDIKLNINSTTEIGRLANSFLRMVDGIRSEVAALEVLSRGDLTPHVQTRGNKDTMGLAIAQILSSLNTLFKEIHQAASQVSSGARQISDSAHSLAQGATEQASAVEKLSASISDVTDKANESLSVASKTNKLANSIKTDAQIGAEQMNRMTNAVKDITDASVAIQNIIKVIDDIAFQTNLLALNASVEAARAGQHGKGFAVVAEEVRNLAAKSAEAAKDTERLILDSMNKAQLGAGIAVETASSLDRIILGINECAVLVNDIARSFDGQIRSMVEINTSVEQVSLVVQQNSATAQESAAASEQMSNQADILEELIARFKLKNNG